MWSVTHQSYRKTTTPESEAGGQPWAQKFSLLPHTHTVHSSGKKHHRPFTDGPAAGPRGREKLPVQKLRYFYQRQSCRAHKGREGGREGGRAGACTSSCPQCFPYAGPRARFFFSASASGLASHGARDGVLSAIHRVGGTAARRLRKKSSFLSVSLAYRAFVSRKKFVNRQTSLPGTLLKWQLEIFPCTHVFGHEQTYGAWPDHSHPCSMVLNSTSF